MIIRQINTERDLSHILCGAVFHSPVANQYSHYFGRAEKPSLGMTPESIFFISDQLNRRHIYSSFCDVLFVNAFMQCCITVERIEGADLQINQMGGVSTGRNVGVFSSHLTLR